MVGRFHFFWVCLGEGEVVLSRIHARHQVECRIGIVEAWILGGQTRLGVVCKLWRVPGVVYKVELCLILGWTRLGVVCRLESTQVECGIWDLS